jgi:hypothetical protein
VFGPFYRADPPDVVRLVVTSGELWGRAPRNFNASNFPKAKAYRGPLPAGVLGFEFMTQVAPDKNGHPNQPTWCDKYGPRPGVVIEDDWAKIKVNVVKVRLS